MPAPARPATPALTALAGMAKRLAADHLPLDPAATIGPGFTGSWLEPPAQQLPLGVQAIALKSASLIPGGRTTTECQRRPLLRCRTGPAPADRQSRRHPDGKHEGNNRRP